MLMRLLLCYCCRSPAASGRPLGSPGRRGRRGPTPSPSPRRESLRPRREPTVNGLPLKYAMALAITQACEIACGKRKVRASHAACTQQPSVFLFTRRSGVAYSEGPQFLLLWRKYVNICCDGCLCHEGMSGMAVRPQREGCMDY